MNAQEMVNRIDELENRTYNLTLYLDYIREQHPLIFDNMNALFDGLPGYAPVRKLKKQDQR